MIYEYECSSSACGERFDVVKPLRDYQTPEKCPKCQKPADRRFSRLQIMGASVEDAEFNPALGCVVKNKKHREELCKRKGLVEIGNDYSSAESIHKEFDQKLKEKREESWNKVDVAL